MFIDKLELNCACVGGNAKVPLGVVSFSENLLMALLRIVLIGRPERRATSPIFRAERLGASTATA